MRRFVRKVVATFCATAAVGCYSWRPVTLEENPDPGTRPEKIRQGAAFDVYNPVVARDSLKGWSDQQLTTPVAFAVSNIANAKAYVHSGSRTALAVGAGILAVIVISYAILLASFFDAIE